MTKSDLKNKDFVKTRRGNILIVIDEAIYGITEGKGGWDDFDSYDEGLKSKKGFETLDIVAVWDSSKHNEGDVGVILRERRVDTWDWERGEEHKGGKTGRVTLDNIEKGEAY